MRPPYSRRNVLLATLAFEGGLGVLALLLGWLLRHPATATWKWSAQSAVVGVAATVPLLILFVVFYRSPFTPLKRIQRFLDEIVRPLFARSNLLDLATISLCAGIGEELLFRGLVQNVASLWLGSKPGWIVASILFGLAHLITPAYAILTTFVGLYLGWLWNVSENLLTPVTTHALYDFVALVLLLKVLPVASPSDTPHSTHNGETL